jgi:hypothetical protein
MKFIESEIDGNYRLKAKVFSISASPNKNIIIVRSRRLNGYEIFLLSRYSVFWDCKEFIADIVDFRIKPYYH